MYSTFTANIQADVMQNININLGSGLHNLRSISSNLPQQIQDILAGINFSGNLNGANVNVYNYDEDSSDDSDEGYDDEEIKEYEVNDEEIDEEADIDLEERNDIINSINSFAYSGKTGENCAVCLSELLQKQQVKKLPCKHIFHPKCINSWMKQKLICPCCKARVNIN